MNRRAGEGAREIARGLTGNKSKLRRLAETVLDVETEERSWRLGAEGEEVMGRKLDRLDADRWRSVHDITIGSRGANLDHLLIGRAGVFTINTKKLKGRIKITSEEVFQNGRQYRMVEKARAEAAKVGDAMSTAVGWSVHITPMLVIVQDLDQPDPVRKGKPGGCIVLFSPAFRIWAFKQRKTEVLSVEQMRRLEVAARRPDTWLPGSSQPTPSTTKTKSTEPPPFFS